MFHPTPNNPNRLLFQYNKQRRYLTDWVIENLETPNISITLSSTIYAGENDTLPIEGLPDFLLVAFASWQPMHPNQK